LIKLDLEKFETGKQKDLSKKKQYYKTIKTP
jgi:hypothetical protein